MASLYLVSLEDELEMNSCFSGHPLGNSFHSDINCQNKSCLHYKWRPSPGCLLQMWKPDVWLSYLIADVFHDWFLCPGQEAVRCGIHRTVHAGEVGPPSVVKEVSSRGSVETLSPLKHVQTEQWCHIVRVELWAEIQEEHSFMSVNWALVCL